MGAERGHTNLHVRTGHTLQHEGVYRISRFQNALRLVRTMWNALDNASVSCWSGEAAIPASSVEGLEAVAERAVRVEVGANAGLDTRVLISQSREARQRTFIHSIEIEDSCPCERA